ncbi:MAG: NAD-dependent epimerase/dehydratase family protein [Thauera sp.]
MNILLTGAAGFTGRFFTKAAQAAGHQVVALAADLTDRDAVHQQVQQAAHDAVVHLAAISFVGHADDAAFYAVNTVGTCHLLQALASLPIKPCKVLLASSANIYGNCDASPIAEEQLPAPVNHYAMSKLAMEHMARTYMDRLPIVLTRPFNYTGPGQALSFVIPKLVSHFARRAPVVELGNMQVEREFNDVRMVCDAYLALLNHGQPGEVYNVCSGRPYALQLVIDTLADLSGHALEAKVNPAFVRANEVHRLCGNPGKLHTLCAQAHVKLKQPSLSDMLAWMLAEAAV